MLTGCIREEGAILEWASSISKFCYMARGWRGYRAGQRWECLEQDKEGENGTKKVKELPHRPGTSELLKFHLNYDAKPTGNVLCSRVRLSYLCCEKIALVAG